MKSFEDYENFYTIVHKFRLANRNQFIHNIEPDVCIYMMYKIVYGHFLDDDKDIFEYVDVYNKQPRIDGGVHKCNISDLQKPNTDEKYYQFLTYIEAEKAKKWHKANRKIKSVKLDT